MTFLSVIPLTSTSVASELLAEVNGFYAKHNLNVDIQVTQGSAPSINTVIAGGALITRIGDIETMLAIATADAPLVNVGALEKAGALRFVSSTRRPLRRPEDFAGATMGLPSTGGTSERTLDLVLASAGIAKEDVPRQVVGLAPGTYELVKQGRIDGYVVSLDTALQVAAENDDAVVFAPSDFISAGVQLYATSRDQAEDPRKQETIRRFLAAIADSVRFIEADRANDFAETIRLLKSKYDIPSLNNPTVAVEALNIYIDSWTAGGPAQLLRTDRDDWQATYDLMAETEMIPGDLDPLSWLTDEFAPAPA